MNGSNELYVLVAGSRTIKDSNFIFYSLDQILNSKEVRAKYPNIMNMDITIVTGNADGVDTIANDYAYRRNFNLIMMPANWNKFGKQAGFVRNEAMHELISLSANRLCICFKDVDSSGRGTTHSIELSARFKNNLIFNYVKYNGNSYEIVDKEFKLIY